jgi:hypothetical protein
VAAAVAVQVLSAQTQEPTLAVTEATALRRFRLGEQLLAQEKMSQELAGTQAAAAAHLEEAPQARRVLGAMEAAVTEFTQGPLKLVMPIQAVALVVEGSGALLEQVTQAVQALLLFVTLRQQGPNVY